MGNEIIKINRILESVVKKHIISRYYEKLKLYKEILDDNDKRLLNVKDLKSLKHIEELLSYSKNIDTYKTLTKKGIENLLKYLFKKNSLDYNYYNTKYNFLNLLENIEIDNYNSEFEIGNYLFNKEEKEYIFLLKLEDRELFNSDKYKKYYEQRKVYTLEEFLDESEENLENTFENSIYLSLWQDYSFKKIFITKEIEGLNKIYKYKNKIECIAR